MQPQSLPSRTSPPYAPPSLSRPITDTGRQPIRFALDEVRAYYASRLPELRMNDANTWRTRCPIHGGDDNNFVVYADSGRWKCFSRCQRSGDILDLEMALRGSDFKTAKKEAFSVVGRPTDDGDSCGGSLCPHDPEPNKPASGRRNELEAQYDYSDESGALLFQVLRYRNPKRFTQRRPNGLGDWIYNLEGVRRVPFRLPEVLAAQQIILVEGEKDVLAVESLGLAASCNPMGAGKWRSEYNEHFRERDVTLVPDNDEPGRRHVLTVAENLLPFAASVRIVDLPGLAAKEDLSDWISKGGTRARLLELAKDAELLCTDGLSRLRREWGLFGIPESTCGGTADHWPEPEPITTELPPVKTLSESLLPDCLRPLVLDIAKRMQVPIDFPAAITVLTLSGAVGRRAVIQPKENDSDWVVVPNLWGGIVARPGLMKSPVIALATRPLHVIEAEWGRAYGEKLAAYKRAKEEFELRLMAWKESFKASVKKKSPTPARPEDEPVEPKAPRLIVNDSTYEALHRTMSDNPGGVLFVRDELTGWLSPLERLGREGEREFFLESWNGDTKRVVDRITRGTVEAEACCLSMLGGIQPGRLRAYLEGAVHEGPDDDGLFQRLQLLVWPDTSEIWKFVDLKPDRIATDQVTSVLRELLKLDPKTPLRFRFAADAQEFFQKWLTRNSLKIRSGDLHPALEAHLSKYPKLMPALALLFELADEVALGREGHHDVSLVHARQAAGWCEYLESHAVRIYSCVVTPQQRAVQELASKIRAKKIGEEGAFSARDVYSKGWGGLDKVELTQHAVNALLDAGWIREEPNPDRSSVGRPPSSRYRVNPKVWR